MLKKLKRAILKLKFQLICGSVEKINKDIADDMRSILLAEYRMYLRENLKKDKKNGL